MRQSTPSQPEVVLSTAQHPRLSEYGRLIYPVISRRSGGLSLGINLNPAKNCNFDCIYCQVDRTIPKKSLKAPLKQVLKELEGWFEEIKKDNGSFKGYPLKDISIAGDGEPTLYKPLAELIREVLHLKNIHGLKEAKLVLFTNGTRILRDDLLAVFPEFMKNSGEIWFKLDYWDQESLKRINRSRCSFKRLIDNLVEVGGRFPLILQSCFFNWEGTPFETKTYQAYAELIGELIEKGVLIKHIQIYSLARTPADSRCLPLSGEQIIQVKNLILDRIEVEILTF
ncbi:MAG: radical SAM protein [Deltaproteobacteria bacterium]|nr:radical SAM protein [Deltaproteobacteria bacterium]